MCLEAIKRGYVTVDSKAGIVYANRYGGKKMGCLNLKGYQVATLHVDGDRKQVKLHRLIWISVHGLPPAGMLIDHRNRIKSNNAISNLLPAGPVENSANRRRYIGAANPSAKITQQVANAIRREHSKLQSYSAVAFK